MAEWGKVRARTGPNEERVAHYRQEMLAEVRAFRLAEIRKERHLTQSQVAESMHSSQPRVSQIESGDIDRAELSTVRSYIEALGGRLEVVAAFGDERQVIA